LLAHEARAIKLADKRLRNQIVLVWVGNLSSPRKAAREVAVRGLFMRSPKVRFEL